MKEIEILVEVKSTKETALTALERFSAHGVKRTLDIYLHDPLRKELQPDENNKLHRSFRLRKKDGKNFLTYKIDHFNGNLWNYSDEFETEVEDFDKMLLILKNLGFEDLVRVDNDKHTFTTPDYEIVLEEVKGLGLFMEVERIDDVEESNVVEAKEEIRNFLKSLNLEFGDEQNAGKPELMLKKRV